MFQFQWNESFYPVISLTLLGSFLLYEYTFNQFKIKPLWKLQELHEILQNEVNAEIRNAIFIQIYFEIIDYRDSSSNSIDKLFGWWGPNQSQKPFPS